MEYYFCLPLVSSHVFCKLDFLYICVYIDFVSFRFFSGFFNASYSLQMTEMCEGLDMLLESIEEPGGFLDACTTFQKSSVEALELGLATLSDQCQIWRVIINYYFVFFSLLIIFFLYFG